MSKKPQKILSNFQTISIIAVLLLIGAALLISSGLFDSVELSANQHTHTNSKSSSANLNIINEINKLEESVKNNPNNHEWISSNSVESVSPNVCLGT